MAIDLGNATPILNLGNASPVLDLGNAKEVLDLGDATPVLDLGDATLIPEQKGFFNTLRNPIDLMFNESIIRQGYNRITGDTQEVQAKRAQDFIEANPELEGTPEYINAQRKLERYGYLLEQGQPFSFEALQEAVKTNPGQMAGEFVNAFMADPYLIFTPYLLGGNALTKFYQANKVLGKVPRLARGAAIGTAAVPEAALYSVIQQAGENGQFDANRMAVETAIGGAGGLGLGVAFGGSLNTIGKFSGTMDEIKDSIIKPRAEAGQPEAIRLYNALELSKQGKPIYFEDKVFDTIETLKGKEFKYNDANAMAMYQDIESRLNETFRKLSVDMYDTSLAKKIYRNSTTPLVAGGVFGAGGALATGEPENFLITGGTVLAGTTFGKVVGKSINRALQTSRGKKLATKFIDKKEWDGFYNEIKGTGVDTNKINIKTRDEYLEALELNKRFNKDLADLGVTKDLLDSKATAISRKILYNMDTFYKLGGMYSHQLNMLFRKEFPIAKSREEDVLKFIQKVRDKKTKQLVVKESDLSSDELKAARAAQKFFAQIHKELANNDTLKLKWRENFLPGFWQRSAMINDNDAKSYFTNFFTETKKGAGYRGRLATENTKVVDSYDEGINAGLEPRTKSLGDIIALYNHSLFKAIAERDALKGLYNSKIPGRTTSKGMMQNFLYADKDLLLSRGVDIDEYVQFPHDGIISANPLNRSAINRINETISKAKETGKVKSPQDIIKLRNKLITEDKSIKVPYVFKEAAPHLKMMFDTSVEKGFFRAISNFNFLPRRLGVSDSFFHVMALFENMFFAGVGTAKIANVAGLGKVPGIRYFIPKTISAKRMIQEGGNGDDYEAALRAGAIFSHPEDIGYHRFYDLIQGANRLADKAGSPLLKWTMQQGIDKLVTKPFKFIDMVTWDHVYNSGKLYTFQTARMKLLRNPANKDVPMHILDRRAAEYTNDAYGGLNWRQIYEDTTNPLLKKVLGEAYNPSGRRILQLLLFAPDWTTANIRIIGKAFPGFNKDPIGRKLYQAYAMRAALIYATFGSALQYMFTGKSLLENKDPTKIDLGNGDSMVFSKQLMEPLHWAVHPYKTLVSKQGSTLKLTQQLLFNKRFLTSPWPSPISEADLFSLYRARDYGEQIGMSLLPFALRGIVEQMKKDGVDFQDGINYILGNFGHPIYQQPKKNTPVYYTGFN